MSKFAVGYAMKKKMAKGGKVEGKHAESHAYNYDDTTSVKGVHEVLPYHEKGKGVKHGSSRAGDHLERAKNGDSPSDRTARAKEIHKGVLRDMKSMPSPKLKGLAEGGDVDHEADMVHRILKKAYSEGGKVANGGDDDPSRMADGDPANFDDLALRDDLEFHDTGENSGDELGGPEEDHEGEDMVKRILKKQRNPRPA